MRVFRIKPTEIGLPVAPIGETVPSTVFSLSVFEQMKYDILHYQQEELEKAAVGLRSGESKNPEEMDLEESIRELFLDLTFPYLKSRGVETASCSVYDHGKNALLQTPFYNLYDSNQPFSISVRVHYDFFLQEELCCTSGLEYHAASGFPERTIVYDVLRQYAEQQQSDGLHFPKLCFKEDLIHFASVDLALTLIDALEAALQKIGLPALQELHELYHESWNQPEVLASIPSDFSPVSSGIFRRKAFREAYEQKLDYELHRAGLKTVPLAKVH